MKGRPNDTCHFHTGERVTVIDQWGVKRGAGVVVCDTHTSGYVGVRLDGERTWDEWPRGWVWMA